MLYAIAAVIVAFWLVGVFIHLVAGVLHLLLAVAIAILIYRLVTGGKRPSNLD